MEKLTVVDGAKDATHGGQYLLLPSSQTLFYAKKWTTSGKPKATLTFVHGIGEHILRYDEMFEYLAKECSVQVFALDQRGFGRTLHLNNGLGILASTGQPNTSTSAGSGSKGNVNNSGGDVVVSSGRSMVMGDGGDWKSTLEDIYRCVQPNDALGNRINGVPHFIYGHSMGGLLVTAFAIEYLQPDSESAKELNVAGVIASAPAYRPGFHVPFLKRYVGSLVSKVLGTLNIPTELDVTGLSREQAVIDRYKTDPYVHAMGSLRTLAGVLEKGEWIATEGWKLWPSTVPLLISFGTEDRLTSYPSGKEVYDRLKATGKGDVSMKVYDGYFHELHNEPEKKQVWKDYADWIRAHISTK